MRHVLPTALILLLSLFAQSALAYSEPDTLRIRHQGLSEPVEIIKDHWGISHIYAENEADLFFAQGYNAAQDRLFQLEMWRRQATGTTAEILGPREVDRDIGARLFKFRGDMQEEMRHYHPNGESIITSFVRGINAYVAETRENPDLLPLEFELLDIEPGEWTPEVVVSRHQGLVGNVQQELNYGRAVHLLGADKVKELSNFHPGDPDIGLDEAIDGSLLFDDILHLYNAYRRSIRFEPDDLVAEFRGDMEAYQHLTAVTEQEEQRMLQDELEDIGSNNWVVMGDLTESGYPIMANDPHRVQAAPALRYWAHLHAPGWNVIGAGEPAIPGISIGHNGFGAWGLTVFTRDSEDLYVYETHPDNPNRYRYQDGWEEMDIIEEEIPVKGQDPVHAELKYTRHGPVVYQDEDSNVAYAVRAAWLDVGAAPYLASLRMDQAESWEEFREACTYNHLPGENMVWADREGNIGWQATGISPLRSNWSGLVPVPGDGSYEWDGYLAIEELPNVHNPEKGFFATANANLIPHDYEHTAAKTYTWADPYRTSRVNEVLGSGRQHSMMDMVALQTDYLSIPARQLVPLLDGLEAGDERVEEARQRLLDWDFVLHPRSVQAGIYVAWERRLRRNIADLFIPEEARRVIGSISMTRTIEWLVTPRSEFGDDPVQGRDAFLLGSLQETVEELTERLGPNIDDWQYGQEDYKHARIRHPLSAAANDTLRSILNVGPAPRGGYSYTVNSTGYGNNQTSGASFRIIVDTENWDNTLGMSNPGQAGDPESPYYDHLFEVWAKDRFIPIYYSRERVEAAASEVTVLEPGR